MRTLLTAIILAAMPPAVLCAQEAAMPEDVALLQACIDELVPRPTQPPTLPADSCGGVVANNCQSPPGVMDTISIGKCIARETRAWEVLMTDAFETALSVAKQDDVRAGRSPTHRRSFEQNLRTAQTAWRAYRDNHCNVVWHASGGTIRSLHSASCDAQLTGERVLFLRSLTGAYWVERY